ncbi:hypothetical protein ACOME3_007826 [Neoechinorhynchus agilis]
MLLFAVILSLWDFASSDSFFKPPLVTYYSLNSINDYIYYCCAPMRIKRTVNLKLISPSTPHRAAMRPAQIVKATEYYIFSIGFQKTAEYKPIMPRNISVISTNGLSEFWIQHLHGDVEAFLDNLLTAVDREFSVIFPNFILKVRNDFCISKERDLDDTINIDISDDVFQNLKIVL